MNILKITTDNQLIEMEWPQKGEKEFLRKEVGGWYERVRPKRLYQELLGYEVCMVVNSDGVLEGFPVNAVASWLYQSDQNGSLIVGDVLIVGEYQDEEDLLFDQIPPEQYEALRDKLQYILEEVE